MKKSTPIPYLMPLYGDWVPKVGDIIFDGKGGYVQVLEINKPNWMGKLMSSQNENTVTATIKVVQVKNP